MLPSLFEHSDQGVRGEVRREGRGGEVEGTTGVFQMCGLYCRQRL